MTHPQRPTDQAQPDSAPAQFPLYDPTAHAGGSIDNASPEVAAMTPVAPPSRGMSRRGLLWLGAAGVVAAGVAVASTNGFGPRRSGSFSIPATAKVIVVTTESGDVQLRSTTGTPSGEWSDMLGQGAQTPTVTMDGDTARISGDGRTDLTVSTGPGVEVRVETRSGDVDGTNLTAARVSVQTASGDVQLRLATAPEQVSISTASGDVDLTLPKQPAGDGYAVTTQTASGDVDAIASDGHRQVNVSTASGDIDVSY